jgi:murein DD-endopeptidase MepM/ murein hydrolase activator NlpD
MEPLEERMLLSAEPMAGAIDTDPRLVLPIAGVPWATWTISEYFDADPASGIAVDYAGGDRTYDGHDGIDFALPHLAAMDQGVDVLAAAPGTVIDFHDGEFDRHTVWLNPAPASNYVVIDHGQGWTTRYFHLKRDSLTVALGQIVTAGQPIAQVGSSGKSSGPHLHFEAQRDGRPIDLNQPAYQSLWDTALPYVDDAAGLLDAGITAADPAGLLQRDERPADRSDPLTVPVGSTQRLHLWFMPVGVDAADALSVTWTKPDGSTHWTQTFAAPGSHSNWFTAWIDAPIPGDAAFSPEFFGVWTAAITLNGQTLGQRAVTILGPPPAIPENTGPDMPRDPLPDEVVEPPPTIALGPRLSLTLADQTDSEAGLLTGLHAGQLQRGQRKAQSIVLRNDGDETLRVKVSPPRGGLFALAGSQGQTRVVRLSPGESRTLTVRALARNTGGFADRLVLRSNDAQAPRCVIALRGRVTLPSRTPLADAALWWARTDERPTWEEIVAPTQNHIAA